MRKKTAPRTRKHQKVSSRKQPGLIAKGKTAQQSAGTTSALDNRSHRTRPQRSSPHRTIQLVHGT